MNTKSLSERLPTSYALNLSDMTQEQREAIEEDRQRWNKARIMIRDMQPWQIRAWLDEQQGEYRTDMARRLNVKKARLKK